MQVDGCSNFHIQTLKANKAEIGEKIKICLFLAASQVSEGDGAAVCCLLPLWGRRHIQKMGIMHLDGPIKGFSSTGMLIIK